MGMRTGEDTGHELFQAARPPQSQRLVSVVEGKRGQKPRKSKEVVAVEVGDEDSFQRAAPQSGMKELKLCSLAAVKEKRLILPLENGAGQAAPEGGHGRAGAEDGGFHDCCVSLSD